MPDWRAEIRQRLQGLGLDPLREAAIVEELAAALRPETLLVGRFTNHPCRIALIRA